MGVSFDIDIVRDEGLEFPPRPLDSTAQSLRIVHCRYNSLEHLNQFRGLKVLEIAGFPDASLDSIGQLTELRWLRLLHMPRVTSLAPLARLTQLRCLSLATSPGWDASGKVSCIESLQPIADLPALQHLELFGVVPVDRSLTPLEQSRSLRSVRVSKYPKSEMVRFRGVTTFSDSFMPEANAA